MPKFEGRKLDLLQECNERQEPPREFMAVFCAHCRNASCVNAGFASSQFEDRIAEQVTRLLTHPTFADPEDPNYKSLREIDFKNLEEPIVVRGGDPWAGPQVHLADQDRRTQTNDAVEEALAALAESRGKKPPPKRAVEALGAKSDEVVSSAPESENKAPDRQPAQTPLARPQQAPKANPRHYILDTPGASPTSEGNTPFPNEGVMLDGSLPAAPGAVPAEDPWTASGSPSQKKVAVGATVKMSGGPKK